MSHIEIKTIKIYQIKNNQTNHESNLRKQKNDYIFALRIKTLIYDQSPSFFQLPN